MPDIAVREVTYAALKNFSAQFPHGSLTLIQAPYGAGKTNLLRDVLYQSSNKRSQILSGQLSSHVGLGARLTTGSVSGVGRAYYYSGVPQELSNQTVARALGIERLISTLWAHWGEIGGGARSPAELVEEVTKSGNDCEYVVAYKVQALISELEKAQARGYSHFWGVVFVWWKINLN